MGSPACVHTLTPPLGTWAERSGPPGSQWEAQSAPGNGQNQRPQAENMESTAVAGWGGSSSGPPSPEQPTQVAQNAGALKMSTSVLDGPAEAWPALCPGCSPVHVRTGWPLGDMEDRSQAGRGMELRPLQAPLQRGQRTRELRAGEGRSLASAGHAPALQASSLVRRTQQVSPPATWWPLPLPQGKSPQIPAPAKTSSWAQCPSPQHHIWKHRKRTGVGKVNPNSGTVWPGGDTPVSL